MIEKLRNHLLTRLGPSPSSLDVVISRFSSTRAMRGQQLLRQGDVCNRVYFVASGALQVFVYDGQFNETTRDIVLEDSWCSELMSFGQRKPATENIRAIEDCELLAIDYDSFQALMATVEPFGLVYKQVLELSYANSVYRVNSLVSMTASERIQWLFEHRPQLAGRVSSKLIASYLGISPETYSRLKSK
jgi:CRP-like cAMP-binding protein